MIFEAFAALGVLSGLAKFSTRRRALKDLSSKREGKRQMRPFWMLNLVTVEEAKILTRETGDLGYSVYKRAMDRLEMHANHMDGAGCAGCRQFSPIVSKKERKELEKDLVQGPILKRLQKRFERQVLAAGDMCQICYAPVKGKKKKKEVVW